MQHLHRYTPALKPGDVVFFTEAATHGTLPWCGGCTTFQPL